MPSKFLFLKNLYPELFNCARLAETLYYIDASSSISKSRLFCEKLVGLIAGFESEDISHLNQHDAIQYLNNHEILPDTITDIFHVVRKSGNRASHNGYNKSDEALFILKKYLVWLSGFLKLTKKIPLKTLSMNYRPINLMRK
ncbi:DUF4145 domain-containing protein [Chryseobacterium sp. CH25]|uniref:DUF4145 domain-containing protein n=1 Tax=Chryseobacterium sp. CH25 TaxID=713559 RepID=UPI001E48EB19|nr:DUF4145 domain-containing protein [Chryseobacterium sp. CH25]